MNILDRFLKYVKIDTQSKEESEEQPSTSKQLVLAELLRDELTAMGPEKLIFDREHGYVYAHFPATPGYEHVRKLGLIAHMDTSPAMKGEGVAPRIIKEYSGGDIRLSEQDGSLQEEDNKPIIMKADEFPELEKYVGMDLVVTDGTTLLGADDKAGIAEIMYAIEFLTEHPEIIHGPIRIAFTPDEEIGRGTEFFDMNAMDAEVAYTVDGGALGEVEYENFNAASGKVLFHGKSVHPGYAKGKMVNALLVAMEFHALMPPFENPMFTEGYEGFYHLDSLQGTVEEAKSEYIIRDHDKEKFEQKKEFFTMAAFFMNEKYGYEAVTAQVNDSYYNMKEIMEKNMDLVDLAVQVMEEGGIEPKVVPIRGGTDGATLSFKGLPCPNLCTGGENFHGKYEYIPVQSMEYMGEYLVTLVTKFAQRDCFCTSQNEEG